MHTPNVKLTGYFIFNEKTGKYGQNGGTFGDKPKIWKKINHATCAFEGLVYRNYHNKEIVVRHANELADWYIYDAVTYEKVKSLKEVADAKVTKLLKDKNTFSYQVVYKNTPIPKY